MLLQVEKMPFFLKTEWKIGIQNIKQVEFISYKLEKKNLLGQLNLNPNGSWLL
jgi:hypothetical protein